MKKSLLLLTIIWLALANHMASAQCDADTSIFYLPQNEFNGNTSWYFTHPDEAFQWSGGLNFYDMYDPCVSKNNTLIISEVNQGAGNQGAFIELTNVGDEAIDLSQYRLISQRNSYPSVKVQRMSHFVLEGTLAAGECYVIMAAYYANNATKMVMDWSDSVAYHNVKLEAIADFKTPSNTAVNAYPNVVGRTYDVFDDTWRQNLILSKIVSDTIEVAVDVFNISHGESNATIAGVPNAPSTNTIVRKQFIDGRTYGNTDFKISAGSEAAEASEWIVLPRFRSGTSHLPTTIGSHNTTSVFGISAKEGTATVIDEINGIIHLPATAYKGDSVLSYLNVNADMAWEYQTNGVLEDNVSNLIHTGDTITFYHCGVDVTIKSYRIEALPLTGKSAIALCMNRKNDLARMYYETIGLEVDTIYGNRIHHDYPVDTLLAYIEIADSATAEIVWANGDEPRPTLVEGDKLRVTSKDGATTHDYYIALVPYANNILSHDARLNTITWPDYPVDDFDPYLWNTGDTIPGFNKDAFSYIIVLPSGTQAIPALQAVTNNGRASFTSVPATNLYGSEEAQTTTFTITAEDDTTIQTYAIRFIVETDDWTYEGQPFFSEISYNTGSSINLEICNPSNVLLDLSDYVVAVGRGNKKTLPTLLAWQTKAFDRNVHIYRPGYSYDSLTMVTNQQYWFDPNGDANVDAFVEPGGVFTIASTRANGSTWGYVDVNTRLWASGSENGIIDGPNVILHGTSSTKGWEYNKYGGSPYDLIGRTTGTSYKSNTFFLLRILNDSVKDGTISAAKPLDYEIIDVVGKIEPGQTCGWLNPVTGEPFYPNSNTGVLIRQPKIYQGNPVSTGSFGYAGIETPGDYDATNPVLGDSAAFEWTYQTGTGMANYDMGRHTLAPVTVYKSSVKSEKYSVSLGLSMEETIFGVSENTTAADFLANIIKMHDGQTLQLATTDGSLIFDFDVIQEGNLLKVTSADGVNESSYTIHVGELSSDVSLTSDEYTVSENGVAITDINTTINDFIANVSVSATSQLYIVNGGGNFAALKSYDFRDSVYTDAIVSGDLKVKVVAQTGAEKLYSIDLPGDASSAYLTSNTYKVDQSNKHINGVVNGINANTLLNNLTPCDGATLTLVNKWEQKKTFGIVLYNDVIKVVSADQSTTVYYGITLNTEVEPEIILSTPQVAENAVAVVYPNPTTGLLNLSTACLNVVVYDITGKAVKTFDKKVTSINISELNSGIYILSATKADGLPFTVKITKQ